MARRAATPGGQQAADQGRGAAHRSQDRQAAGLRFHNLRHSHSTQLLASGIDPKIASARLGHASVGITLDLYSHVTDTMQGEVAAKLDSAMQVAKSRIARQKYELR
jgi:integrase